MTFFFNFILSSRLKWLVSFILLGVIESFAGNHVVNVGESITLYNTASAPAGYITHAFFSLDDPDDANYVALYSYSSDQYATVYGLKAKSSIRIKVTYAYSYLGTYDNRMHVDHGTYYEYITVKGGIDPESVEIPSTLEMAVGQTIEVNAKLTPTDAATIFSWGFITGFGQPYNFDISYIGSMASVKAKKAGEVYLMVQTANNKTAVCVITAKDNSPTSIELPEQLNGYVGDSIVLNPVFYPEGTYSVLKWNTSDPNKAAIKNGTVHLTGEGSFDIFCESTNGKQSNKCIVSSKYKEPDNIQIANRYEKMYVGETLPLSCIITPSSSKQDVIWGVYNNSDAVSVSQDGVVTALEVGHAQISAQTTNGLVDVCSIRVLETPERIEVPEHAYMIVDQTSELDIKFYPEGSYDKYKITSSSYRAVINGKKITAKYAGTAKLNIETPTGLTSTCELVIKNANSIYANLIDGEQTEIVLSSKPTIEYTEDNVIIITKKETIEIPLSNLVNISFLDQTETGTTSINEVKTSPLPLYTGDANGNSDILVYLTNGKLVKKFPSISLSSQINLQDLSAGLYIVKIGNKSIKYLKK